MTGGDGTASAAPATAEASPWAPLRHRAFAMLWTGVLVANLGTYMQTLGAQWLLVGAPGAAALVALVQTANMLPAMLLAMTAGVLGDLFDRRIMLLAVQAYFIVVSAALVVLTLMDLMPPDLLLVFTLLLGIGTAVQLPIWQACPPDLVPREELRPSARLEMVGLNFARAAGPALGGVVISVAGVEAVFALNLISVIPFGVALLLWRRPAAAPGPAARERFWAAMRAGIGHVWRDRLVRNVMLRVTAYILPAAAMWALLPLIASERLHLGSAGFGVLFAALGVGAIIGALVVGPIRRRLGTGALLTGSGIVMAVALGLLVMVLDWPSCAVVLIVAGLSWTATVSTLIAELRLLLPRWVMARGMAVWTMVFTGAQAVGAIAWGAVATATGLVPTFLAAAVLSLAAAGVSRLWKIEEVDLRLPVRGTC